MSWWIIGGIVWVVLAFFAWAIVRSGDDRWRE